jgi:hypothetical protein
MSTITVTVNGADSFTVPVAGETTYTWVGFTSTDPVSTIVITTPVQIYPTPPYDPSLYFVYDFLFKDFAFATGLVPAPSVTSGQPGYTDAQSIVVSWAHLPGNSHDWIAIAPVGAPPAKYIRWVYTGGRAVGSTRFAALPAGSYEPRAFLNDTLTLLATGAPFTVTSTGTASPTVAVGTNSYAAGSSIDVTWTNLAGYEHDWIAICHPADLEGEAEAWIYTGGARSGAYTFPPSELNNVRPGTYEVRAYLNDGITRQATSGTFSVISPTVAPNIATNSLSYLLGNEIIVEYQGMSGASHDWISIAVQGSADTSNVAWVYIGGQIDSQHGFFGIPAGTYVARAFFNDGLVKQAESAPFVVMP